MISPYSVSVSTNIFDQYMNKEAVLKNYLEQELALESPAQSSFVEMKKILSEYVNQLILHDFEKLVRMLYRIDVNENRLKHILIENPNENACDLIAEMIIERQIQKINTREQFNTNRSEDAEEERW